MEARILVVCFALLSLATANTEESQTKKIESFHVISDIRYRFATTQIVSLVRNTADYDQEIVFGVTLPKEAFIMHFAMSIDGKIYEGEVKEKKAAKRQYQLAVDRGQSAGHVAQDARNANLFDVSVNVAKGSAVNFTLTYQELLRRKLGLYHHEVHVNPGQPVEDFLVKVFVKDKAPITLIRTPPIQKDYLISNDVEATPKFVSVVQRDPRAAYIEYAPSLDDQGSDGLNARFLMQYDVEHDAAGDLLVVDGYFVHFYAPTIPPMPKDIIFVLDKSGSMFGRKIQQLRTAMKSILKDLLPQDQFNIINFSDNVHPWKYKLSPADNDVKAEASAFVDTIGASGGTNINEALLKAVESLQKREVKSRAPIVFFLTDGQATTGVTGSEQIKDNIRTTNEGVVTIISLAFGDYADYDLMKGISVQNSGFARKIYEASDSALQVATLYKEISAVSMRNLSVTYLEGSVDEFSVTDQKFPVVFNGSEIIICGRLDKPAGRFEMDINAIQKDGDLSLKFETENVENFIIEEPERERNLFNSPRDYGSIVERMWAFLNIKQMLKEREIGMSNETQAEQLKQKIIDLAVKYKFVTPLTSMVVTKPEQNGNPGGKDETVETGLTDADLGSTERLMSSNYRRVNSKSYGFRGPSGQMQSASLYDMDPFGLPGLPPKMLASDYYGGSTSRVVSQPRKNFRPSKHYGGRGRAQRTKQRKPKRQPVLNIARIIIESQRNALCACIRGWLPGNYSLLKKPPNGKGKRVPLILEVSELKRKFKGVSFGSIYLDDGTWVKINVSSAGVWNYGQGRKTTVSLVKSGLGLQLERAGQIFAEIEILNKTKRVWNISVIIKDSPMGDKGKYFKKFVRPKTSKRLTRWCNYNNSNYPHQGVFPKKRAWKLRVRSNN